MSLKAKVLGTAALGRAGFFAALALAAALSLPAAAQPSGEAAARLALLEAVEAHGGRAALEGFGDAVETGVAAVARADGFEECSIAVKTRGLAQVRSEVSCPVSGSRVHIHDGRWARTLVDGVRRPVGLERSSGAPQHFNPALGTLGLFLRGRLRPVSVREEGGARVVAAWSAGAVRPDGTPVAGAPLEIELDGGSGLVWSVRLWERGRDGRILPEPAVWLYSDWREEEGLAVPLRVEEVRGGAVVGRFRFVSFETARHGNVFGEP